jgi:hypothetical protein
MTFTSLGPRKPITEEQIRNLEALRRMRRETKQHLERSKQGLLRRAGGGVVVPGGRKRLEAL